VQVTLTGLISAGLKFIAEIVMKSYIVVFLSAIVLLGAVNVEARDDRGMWSISEALNTEDAKQKLNKDIQFYFEYMANKKTNAFNKTDKRACQWNFLSAMLSFQDRALSMGGNAVVNIRSYYKKNEISSQTEFQCGSGAFVSGVTFLGDVVKLKK